MQTKCLEEYDRYKGIKELMPYAKGVHAKHMCLMPMVMIRNRFCKDVYDYKGIGFSGWVSVEYEGGLIKMYSKDDKYLMMMQVCLRQKTMEKVAAG